MLWKGFTKILIYFQKMKSKVLERIYLQYLHKHVTNLAFKIGQTEKTNIELKNMVKELSTDNSFPTESDSGADQPSPSHVKTYNKQSRNDLNNEPETDEQIKIIPTDVEGKEILRTKTYAKVTTQKTNTQLQHTENQSTTWTTPKIQKRFETLITIDKIFNPIITMQTLKQSIASKDTGGSFKNVRYLKN